MWKNIANFFRFSIVFGILALVHHVHVTAAHFIAITSYVPGSDPCEFTSNYTGG